MNNHYFKGYLCICLLLCPLISQAQFFENASNRLSDTAAIFQTKDVYTADIDYDGDMDIILANEYQNNTILINDGNAFFTDGNVGLPPIAEHDSEAIAMADFNLDGKLDLLFLSEDDFQHEYYIGNDLGGFQSSMYFLPFTKCRAGVVGELDGNPGPDVILGNDGQNMILVNDGAGQLLNQTFGWLPFVDDRTQDLALSDVDMDGDLDLFVANEDHNFLFMNDGTGIFTDQTSDRLPQGLNIDSRRVLFEDVDSDGDEDVFLCNVAFSPNKDPKNRLYLNDGNGYFTDVTEARLPAYNDQSLDAVFTDVDLDGDRDLIIANVLGVPLYCYANDGTGNFIDKTSSFLGNYMTEAFGIALADYNGDGFEDLYICNLDGKDLLLLRDPLALATNNPLQETKIAAYPNPTKGTINIELGIIPNSEIVFTLQNTSGQIIGQRLPADDMGNGTFQINLTSYEIPAGMYMLQARTAKESYAVKVFLN